MRGYGLGFPGSFRERHKGQPYPSFSNIGNRVCYGFGKGVMGREVIRAFRFLVDLGVDG